MVPYQKQNLSNKLFRRERLGIFLSSISFMLILVIILGTLCIIIWNSVGVFWQAPVFLWQLKDGSQVLGEKVQSEVVEDQHRIQVKTYNREIYGQEFYWLNTADITNTTTPDYAVLIERLNGGAVLGFFGDQEQQQYSSSLLQSKKEQYSPLAEQLEELQEKNNDLNKKLFELLEQQKALAFFQEQNSDAEIAKLQEDVADLRLLLTNNNNRLADVASKTATITLPVLLQDGQTIDLPFSVVLDYVYPNQLQRSDKIWLYAERLFRWFSSDPREANTEGGVFPAIIGTVVLIILMSVLCFPLGVITAIYLCEYAKDGWLVRLIRISVNNLAGVPSIVYGIFGLGFFVYGVGSWVDEVFFPESLPNSTYGTGGLLWASLVLGLLTAPVVIVTTEEALSTLPKGLREASLALGATQFQTLLRVVLPMVAPGMLTGFILAMARAAGEVAPLMITGVVKLAPNLPIDGDFPFIHLNRKFMHLGFHIFDLGFQSPNIESARPMVYMTTFLLLSIVVFLSITAFILREKMRSRYFSSSL